MYKRTAIIAFLSLLVVALGLQRYRRANLIPPLLASDHTERLQSGTARKINYDEKGTKNAIGVSRAFVPLPGQVAPAIEVDPLAETEMRRIGSTPAIDKRAPGSASVVEALQTGKHPERLSVAIAPAPFDAVAFARNPDAYLAIVEPGRVFQCCQPGPGVAVLSSLVEDHLTVIQGGQLELAVRAVPLAPVSFTSLDLGIFAENTLAAITVRADAEGIARVHLKAMPGTAGEVSTLVGCPLASGRLRLLISIDLPEATLSAVVKP